MTQSPEQMLTFMFHAPIYCDVKLYISALHSLHLNIQFDVTMLYWLG